MGVEIFVPMYPLTVAIELSNLFERGVDASDVVLGWYPAPDIAGDVVWRGAVSIAKHLKNPVLGFLFSSVPLFILLRRSCSRGHSLYYATFRRIVKGCCPQSDSGWL